MCSDDGRNDGALVTGITFHETAFGMGSEQDLGPNASCIRASYDYDYSCSLILTC